MNPRLLLSAAALGLGYLATALAGTPLTRGLGEVAVFWPANALALGVLLRAPGGSRPPLLAAGATACLTAHLAGGGPAGVAALLAAANMLEVVCGYLQARAIMPGFPPAPGSLRALGALAGVGVAAPVAGATFGAAVLAGAVGAPFAGTWWAWWCRDAAALLILLPALALAGPLPALRLPRGSRPAVRAAGLAAAYGALGALSWQVVARQPFGPPPFGSIALLTPVLLWLALRHGVVAAAVGSALLWTAAVAGAVHQIGALPFAEAATLAGNVAPLQLLVALTALPALAAAAAVAERDRARRELAAGERRHAFVLEGSGDGLWDWHIPSGSAYLSPRWEAIQGYAPGELRPSADTWAELAHPEDRERVARVVSDHLEGRTPLIEVEHRSRHKDGRWVPVLVRGKVVERDAEGRPLRAVGLRSDLTARDRLERAEHMALHDPLTDLPNRAMFGRELRRAVARARRDGGRVALLLVDLDRFKQVNDGHGHAAGDRLLVEVAARLRAAVREGDLVARLGGDEVAVVASGTDPAEFAALAARVAERLGEEVRLGGIRLRAGASVGLALHPDDSADTDGLLADADSALYAAKGAGRGTWVAFEPRLRVGDDGDPTVITRELEAALELGDLDLDYQPVVDLATLGVVGVEALLRWNHHRRGRLPAAAFVREAERDRLAWPVTAFALGRALRQQRAWRSAGVADLTVSVNLAPACARREGLADAVAEELAAAGVPPGRLVVEIRDGSAKDLERAEREVAALRRLGVAAALDDFGAGRSDVALPAALGFGQVKLDRALVADLGRDGPGRAVVAAAVAVAGRAPAPGLVTVANGVETDEQLAALRRLGCARGQGHHFARPMPAAELGPWLAAWEERRRATRPGGPPAAAAERAALEA